MRVECFVSINARIDLPLDIGSDLLDLCPHRVDIGPCLGHQTPSHQILNFILLGSGVSARAGDYQGRPFIRVGVPVLIPEGRIPIVSGSD